MLRRAALLRAAGFLGLWLVLAGGSQADMPAAIVAVFVATYVSLLLSPPSGGIVLRGLAELALHFPLQSLMAGIDVARRAFSPALPLSADTIGYTPRLPPGSARDAFMAYASLMPGTIPVVVDTDKTILIHCLDARQPVAQQMEAEEARFIRLLGRADA